MNLFGWCDHSRTAPKVHDLPLSSGVTRLWRESSWAEAGLTRKKRLSLATRPPATRSRMESSCAGMDRANPRRAPEYPQPCLRLGKGLAYAQTEIPLHCLWG